MSSPIIPKEHLTAYQRWELLGFDESNPSPARDTAGNHEQDIKAVLPTAEELEHIHQQAAQEGFKTGHDEGYRAGYEAGRKSAEALVGQLAGIVEALDLERVRQDEEVAKELLALALAVSKQMVRVAFQIKEGLVQEIVREAMNALPSLNGHLRIVVHPDDVEPLKAFMEFEHGHFSFKVTPDSRIERGGFRIESNHSEVDGQLPVRWREIVDCLGSDSEWLE